MTAPPTAAQRKANRERRIQGLVAGRPLLGPHTVHFDIANACNTRCTTCWHHSPHLAPEHRPSAAWRRQRLPLSAFAAMLDDLVALGGLEQIILSGMGDPTLNPELPEMVERAHGRGIGVTIITNLLRADLPRLLASPGELQLLASICGVTPGSWRAFHAHPRPGGFARLREQLRILRTRGVRPKHVQVINRDNFHELVEMVRFAADWPAARVSFKLASLSRGTEAVALTREDKVRLASELVPAAVAEAARLGVPTDLAAFARQIDPDSHKTAPIEEIGCFMGYVYARVTVAQELLYCCNTRLSLGHVAAQTPISALWESPRYAGLRASLRRGVYFEGCDQCGKLKQNVKWSERLEAKLPEAIRERMAPWRGPRPTRSR